MENQVSDAAIALRESFGDRKLPDISRKITACVACRKQKIKCHMQNDEPPCTRCRKRGLSCAVNKSLQMLLESDISWKSVIQQKVQDLENLVSRLSQHVSLPEAGSESPHQEMGQGQVPTPQARTTDKQDHPHWEVVMDSATGFPTIPGSSVSQVIGLDAVRPGDERLHADLISRSILPETTAQNYYDLYQKRLDHFLYSILGIERTMENVRSQSPFLTAIIFTVGSLHTPTSTDFDQCYRESMALAATHMLSRDNTIDDLRAFLIGAFWLSGHSWSFSGAAVRVATEMHLDRSIFRALDGDKSHYLRARLYYLIYVCDHHFSVPYGRPPMTRQCQAVRLSSRFLKCPYACEDDARLISQVQMWSVATDILETFGSDVETPLSADLVPLIDRFSNRLDDYRAEWTAQFSQNSFVGNYPAKGVTLHANFAKLYLYSNAFRGLKGNGTTPPGVAMELHTIAGSAVYCASSILRAITVDVEIQSYLNGLPTYFDIMIAFAGVFLMKMCVMDIPSISLDRGDIRKTLEAVIETLKGVTSQMHPRHLLTSISTGLGNLFGKCFPDSNEATPRLASQGCTAFDLSLAAPISLEQPDWVTGSFDFSMADFDMLSTQFAQDDTFDFNIDSGPSFA